MDKKIEEFFDKLDDKKIKEDFLETQNRLEIISELVQNYFNKIQLNPTKENVERLEKYMPIVKEFMNCLKSKRDFLIIMGMSELFKGLNDKVNSDYIKFQNKIDKKSKLYERM